MNDFTTVNFKNRDLFYIIVLVLTFIVVVIGATFAIYAFITSQKEGDSYVYTGTLSIEYQSGKIISIRKMFPIRTPNYDETENVYRNSFVVKNVGTLDSLVDINLNLRVNEFSRGVLKYNLYDSNKEVVAEGVVYGNGKLSLLTNYVIEHEKEENFLLIIWIEENNENQNSEMRKSLEGLIEIDAGQKLE